jgi:hypothetical protein
MSAEAVGGFGAAVAAGAIPGNMMKLIAAAANLKNIVASSQRREVFSPRFSSRHSSPRSAHMESP